MKEISLQERVCMANGLVATKSGMISIADPSIHQDLNMWMVDLGATDHVTCVISHCLWT